MTYVAEPVCDLNGSKGEGKSQFPPFTPLFSLPT